MAKLTDYLPAVMSGKETQRPTEAGPSLFEGLAAVAGATQSALSGAADTRNKRAAAARQARDDALEASDRGAKNYAAEVALGLGTLENPVTTTAPGQMPRTEEVVNTQGAGVPYQNVAPEGGQIAPLTPSEAVEVSSAQAEGNAIGQEAMRLQAGVRQGRISSAQYEMLMEARLREGFAMFPESKAVLMETVSQFAINHPSLSEWRAVRAAEERATEAEAKREENAIEFAVTKRGFDPNLPREILIEGGYRAQAEEAQLDVEIKIYNHQRAMLGDNREDLKLLNESRDEAFSKWAENSLGSQFQPGIAQLNTYMNDPNIPDAEKMKAAGEFIRTFQPKAYELIEDTVARLQAEGMSVEAADAVRKRLRSQVKDVFVQFDPNNPVNVFAITGKIYQTMKDKLGMDVLQATPVFQAFKQAFGNTEAVQLMVDQIAQDPNLRKAFTREMTGFTGLALGDQTVRIRNVMAIMADRNTSLRDLSPEEGAQVIATSKQLLDRGFYRIALTGDPDAQRVVFNTLGKVANAAIDLNSGSSTDALINSVLYLANAGSFRLLKNPSPEQAEFAGVVGDEMRVAVGKSLMHMLGQAEDPDAWHQIRFSVEDGKFYAKPVRELPRGNLPVERGLGRDVLPERYPALSKEQERKMFAMNRALEFLVNTEEFEDNPALKNASRLEKFNFYIRGEVPASAVSEEAGKRVSGREQISRLQNFWSNIKVDWSTLPQIDVNRETARLSGQGQDPYDVVLGFGEYGSPPKPLTQMTIEEVIDFGKNTLIPNSRAAGVGRDERGLVGSSASGAFQITQETLTEIGEEVLGENWRTMKFTPQVQDRLGKYLFEKNKNGNLKNIWSGLPDSTPGAYADMSWEQVRDIIIEHESS